MSSVELNKLVPQPPVRFLGRGELANPMLRVQSKEETGGRKWFDHSGAAHQLNSNFTTRTEIVASGGCEADRSSLIHW
jgi:hypothetical protein